MKLYAVKIPNYEEPILVDEAGVATNRFADGTAGVPKQAQHEAEELFDIDSDQCVGDDGEEPETMLVKL